MKNNQMNNGKTITIGNGETVTIEDAAGMLKKRFGYTLRETESGVVVEDPETAWDDLEYPGARGAYVGKYESSEHAAFYLCRV